jgi:hypothetical protein
MHALAKSASATGVSGSLTSSANNSTLGIYQSIGKYTLWTKLPGSNFDQVTGNFAHT